MSSNDSPEDSEQPDWVEESSWLNEPAWVTEALLCPVRFAQVREDPRIDRWVCRRAATAVGERRRLDVAMIASGGCTVALLAAEPNVGKITAIDPNPAQLAMTRLKIRLLEETPERRLAILGHAPLENRDAELGDLLMGLDLHLNVLGPFGQVSERGPDYTGRFELLFAALRTRLAPHLDELETVLQSAEASSRIHAFAAGQPIGDATDAALDAAFALPFLIKLFSAEATQNARKSFPAHFEERLRWAVAALPTANNSFLWQFLVGTNAPGCHADWFAAPVRRPETVIETQLGTAKKALGNHTKAFDVIQLSNILDWLSADDARALLDIAANALRPNGWIIVRQLNTTLGVRKLGEAFNWDHAASQMLHAADRSFFYRAIHVGKRR